MKRSEHAAVSEKDLRKYFSLQKEIQEKKQEALLLYSEVDHMRRSFSFRVWRMYNKILSFLGKKQRELPNARQPAFYENIADTVSGEIDRCEKLLKRVDKTVVLLDRAKTGIENSRYYTALRSMHMILRSISDIPTLPVRIIQKTVPYKYRRIVRHLFASLIYRGEHVSDTIQKEWDAWKAQRREHACDVFIFGITAYGYRMQRPQHLAKQLVDKGNRVFYIENEFIPVLWNASGFAPYAVRKESENLYVIKLSCPRNLFIYSDVPTKNELQMMMQSLKKVIRDATIVNPIAKIDHPFWGYLAHLLQMRVIYDCMDEHAGFQENAGAIETVEKKLMQSSSIVLYSSAYLQKKLKKDAKNKMVYLPNACEFAHFQESAMQKAQIPEDIASIPGPIIGYYGAIAEWMDLQLVQKVLKTYPQYSFVFIGRVMNESLRELAKTHKNLYLLGEKPYEQLPAYMKAFTVCTIPFQLTDLIQATHPVKFFEYAASGKPIVTTALPELKKYRSICYYATSHTQYIAMLKKAVVEKKSAIQKRRIACAKKETWDKRGEVLNNALQSVLFSKVSVVVLSYNNADLTMQCLDSIQQRSYYPDIEVIVVDNASEKDERKKIAAFCKKNKIQFIANKKNEGFAKGNNIGMKKSKGKYIILLNNDTVVTPGWIERLIFHSTKKNVGLVGPITNNIGNEMRVVLSYNKQTLDGLEDEAVEYTAKHWGETREMKMLAAFCWLLPRTIYKKYGGLDEAYGQALFEDDDYCMRLKKDGLVLLGADDVFIHHYGSKAVDAMNRIEHKKLFEKNRAYFEQKWDTVWTPHRLRLRKGKK